MLRGSSSLLQRFPKLPKGRLLLRSFATIDDEQNQEDESKQSNIEHNSEPTTSEDQLPINFSDISRASLAIKGKKRYKLNIY
jgi:hypothetical protein